jgi:hypothetical protein
VEYVSLNVVRKHDENAEANKLEYNEEYYTKSDSQVRKALMAALYTTAMN